MENYKPKPIFSRETPDRAKDEESAEGEASKQEKPESIKEAIQRLKEYGVDEEITPLRRNF